MFSIALVFRPKALSDTSDDIRIQRPTSHFFEVRGGGFDDAVIHSPPFQVIPHPGCVQDRFGDSGAPWELVKEFEVSAEHIVQKAAELMVVKKARRINAVPQ